MTEEKTEEKGSLIYMSRVRDKIRGTFDGKDEKFMVASDAKLIEYLETCVLKGIDILIDCVPKFSKGDHVGEFKFKTIKKEFVDEARKKIEVIFQAKPSE